jgi:hypothetical protein
LKWVLQSDLRRLLDNFEGPMYFWRQSFVEEFLHNHF